MRLVKLSILGALLAFSSSALVGPTAASATDTELCRVHEDLACPENPVTATHFNNAVGIAFKFLSSLVSILCLSALVETTVSASGTPQNLHATSLEFTGCGTSSSHTNCSVTTEKLPLLTLLKTGLDEGVLTSSDGSIRLQCANLGINCLYDLEGIEFAAGSGHITAEETPITELGGKFLCPNESVLDFLLEGLESYYVLQPGRSTALCKVHELQCKTNPSSDIHLVTSYSAFKISVKKQTRLIECKDSLISGTLSKLGYQRVTITDFTWGNCELENTTCEVKTSKLGTLGLLRGASLNSGLATTGDTEFNIICADKNITCVLGGTTLLTIDGATKSNHGRFLAQSEQLKTTKSTDCEEVGIWDGSYEALEDFYVMA